MVPKCKRFNYLDYVLVLAGYFGDIPGMYLSERSLSSDTSNIILALACSRIIFLKEGFSPTFTSKEVSILHVVNKREGV